MTLLLAALLLCYIDRVIISIAAIEMQKDLSWSDSDKGLVLSSFFLGYLVMQILGGLLANRLGGRNVFLWAVVLWSLFTIVTPLAAMAAFPLLIVARFLLGVVLGYLYYQGRSIWYPIAAHFVNNAMGVFYYYFASKGASEDMLEEIGTSNMMQYMALISLALTAFMFVLWYYQVRNTNRSLPGGTVERV